MKLTLGDYTFDGPIVDIVDERTGDHVPLDEFVRRQGGAGRIVITYDENGIVIVNTSAATLL